MVSPTSKIAKQMADKYTVNQLLLASKNILRASSSRKFLAANQPLPDGLANNKVLDTIYSRKVVVANQLNRETMLLQIKVGVQYISMMGLCKWVWNIHVRWDIHTVRLIKSSYFRFNHILDFRTTITPPPPSAFTLRNCRSDFSENKKSLFLPILSLLFRSGLLRFICWKQTRWDAHLQGVRLALQGEVACESVYWSLQWDSSPS